MQISLHGLLRFFLTLNGAPAFDAGRLPPLEAVVRTQGELFDAFARGNPDCDTDDFITAYMSGATRADIDAGQAYVCTMNARELMEWFLSKSGYRPKPGTPMSGFMPDWIGRFYATYQWIERKSSRADGKRRGGEIYAKDSVNVDRAHEVVVELSEDGGRSWKVHSWIEFQKPLEATEAHEPHVAELRDGTLVAQFRYHGDKWCTLQSESSDGGKTWSAVHETGIPGVPSHLLPLQDGRLLSTFSKRRKAPWIECAGVECAVLSSDGGRSWDVDNTIILSAQYGGNCGDLGYPSTTQLKDGTLVTVYYQVAKPHKKPCLMATKWRLVKSR